MNEELKTITEDKPWKKAVKVKKPPERFVIYKHVEDWDVDILGPAWLDGLWDTYDIKLKDLVDNMEKTQAAMHSLGMDVIWVLR